MAVSLAVLDSCSRPSRYGLVVVVTVVVSMPYLWLRYFAFA